MRKIIIPFLLLIASLASAQTVMVSNASVSPSPLASFQNNGAGVATLTFTESLRIAVPASSIAGLPTTIVSLSMQYIRPKNLDLTLISGTASQYFTVSYNPSTEVLRFKQSALIPANFSGTFIIPIEVTQNSTVGQSYNGFNANIAVISGTATAPGSSYNFTYTLPVIDLNPDTATVPENGSVDVNILDNDLNVPAAGVMTVSSPANGTAVINNNGTPDDITDDYITYTPTPGFNGPTDTFTYTICYTDMPCITETVTITVVPLADLLPDTANVPEDGNITIDVLGNDNNVPATGTFAITQPTNGVVVINNGGTPNDPSDDTVTYTPNPNYNGPDSFTYTLCDVNNVCATETVSLTVTAVVDVYPDSITTLIETAIVVPVQNNDNDIPTSNGSLTVTQPTNGVVSINNGGTPNNPSDDVLTYTPNDDFVGDDTFEYTICDGIGNCDTAIVTITVLADGDKDNVPDITDLDDDNDGILDSDECVTGDCDEDGDDIPNRLDLDSDNDGIPDNIEAQATNSYIAPSDVYTDNNLNGVRDEYDSALSGTSLIPVDSDGDNTPDFLDLDSDNDSFFDIEETSNASKDTDNDGKTNGVLGENGWDNTIETADNFIDVNGVMTTGTVSNFISIYGDIDNDASGAIVVLVNDVDFRDKSIPDYIPTLLIDDTTIIGASGTLDFRVVVADYASNKQQKNKPLRLVIAKSLDFTVSFDSTISTLNGESVNNTEWAYTPNAFSHIFTYTGTDGVFQQNDYSIVGISAVFSATPSSDGVSAIKISVQYNSGGETNNANNDDFDYINYFNN